MTSHIKEANGNASDPNYPDRLVEWAGSATGGVRLVFRDQNGRPVKKQIKTNLVVKAEELAQKIFAGQLLPRLVMFAGGAGNGKTDTLEVILAGICNPELLEEFKANIRDRITKSGRKVIFLPKTSDKKYFPETVRQYDRISFVQDASESYESGDTASGLLAQDLDDLHRTHKDIRELLVLCVNRGVLYTAANEMESKELDTGLIKLILRAIDPVNIDVDCWPVCPSTDLIGQNEFYLWPLDIDSICESLNIDQPSAVEQVLQDLDSRNWAQLEDFSSAHPLRFSRKLLAIPEFRKAFAQLFRQYELISGKTMNFRKLFSVLTYLFTGGWQPAQKKKPSEFSGRILDPVGPDYENLKSAFNAYKHSLPYLLFPSLPDCERLSSHLDNLHNTSSCNALKELEDFIGSISQPCRSGFPGASMFTGSETEWALIMDPARNSTIIEDSNFSDLESDLCLGLDCLEKYNNFMDDASKAVLRRIADISNELGIFSSDKQNADADCKWIGLWIGRLAAVIVKRSIFVWLLSQGKILTCNVRQIKIFNDAGVSALHDAEEYADEVRKFLFGPISIDAAGNNDEFVVHLAKGLCRPFSTDIGGASLAIRTNALECNLLAESELRPKGSILVIEFFIAPTKVHLPIAMAMHDFMERKKRGELFGSMPSALRGVVDTFRLQIDGLAMQDKDARYKLRVRNDDSGTEFKISNIDRKFGEKESKMSFNKSPFYIYPQVETAYDLNLSAALLRASCTTESEGTLWANANKFHTYLKSDDADFWMDGLSLATLMNDSALKAPNTKKTLRHISLTPILARTSSFVANREGVWGATKRMALLARRSCKNENEYKALMKQLFNPSEDVWSSIIDTKIRIFSKSLPEKSLLPISDLSVNLESEYKEHGFDADPRLLKLLFPFTFTNDAIPSPSSKGLASLLDWRCRIPPQHFVALLDSYLRLVSFSEVFHLMVSCHTLVDLMKDASRGLHRDVSAALSSHNNKFRKLETGRDLKPICEKLVEHYISDSRLLDMFSDALVNKKIQFDLCTVVGLEALLSRLKDSVEIRDIFSSCTREHQALLPNEFANGIKRNFEFLNYSVRQRRKPNDISEQYDQGYWARTITRARNAPGIVMVSPVGATLFAGLASAGRPGCTFNEFQRELYNHGLIVTDDYKDKIFNDLKLLGLANDNPDGDGGFLVRNPFYKF